MSDERSRGFANEEWFKSYKSGLYELTEKLYVIYYNTLDGEFYEAEVENDWCYFSPLVEIVIED